MKTTLKKLLSVVLAVVMLCSCGATLIASAAAQPSNGYNPSIIIPGLFQSDVRYLDDQGNDMKKLDGSAYAAPFFMEDTHEIVLDVLADVIAPVSNMLLSQKDKDARAAKAIASVLGKTLAGNIKCDENGQFIKNIKAVKYNTNFSNISQENYEYAMTQMPLRTYAQTAGTENMYFFSYESLGNIMTHAEDLYNLIQIAKSEHGGKKVNLVPVSQGGSIFNALMQYYKDNGLNMEDDVNRVCFIIPAADGAAVLGDIYHYGLLDDYEALYGYMLPSLLGEDSRWLSYLLTMVLRLMPNADLNAILDAVIHDLIVDYLAYSTCLWALIPSKDYPDCREMYLRGASFDKIRAQTDWYYNAQLRHREYIMELKDKGIEFFDIAEYNYPLYKICDSWDKINADGIIHTDSESFGATSVAVDTPLPADYVQKNTYCSDPTHHHIDAGRLVDASTGILCDTTFYFVGQGHVYTSNNDVIIRLATRIMSDNSFKDVYSDPAFPQFNFARHSSKLSILYYKWLGYNTSALSADQKAAFDAAMADARVALASTVMETAAFDAVYERLADITNEIENGNATPGAIAQFRAFVTKIFKWFHDVFLKLFKGNGFSDVLRIK